MPEEKVPTVKDGWNMKTAVIVTNQFSDGGPTPIFKCSSVSGNLVTFLGNSDDVSNPDFIVDFGKEEIRGHWGLRTAMTAEEAKAFGADFGLWFVS